jgi:hypothetical protein
MTDKASSTVRGITRKLWLFLTYGCWFFGFLLEHLDIRSNNRNPRSVASPIFPVIAATHRGKFACASSNFFQTFGLMFTEIVCPSHSTSKYFQPFSTVEAVGKSVILMVISSFPLMAINPLVLCSPPLFNLDEGARPGTRQCYL